MMKFLITRAFKFEAAHRLLGHEGKCAHLHGHSYRAEVTVQSQMREQLDDLGRVVDFSVLDEVIGKWVRTNWDHAAIFKEEDPIADGLRALNQRVFTMSGNPTSENLARYLLNTSRALLGFAPTLRVASVTVHESDKSSATAVGG